ncbi:MAG: hypothetical protein KF896_05460 [Ignavibacteriae bacterium]|jgi:hypothetical protein|nr:hypothetical protein [Ignavibacteriota bacterium]
MGHKKVQTGCSLMNMSENSSNQTKDSKTTETNTNHFNAPCCLNFEFSNDICINLYSIERTKDIFVVSLIAYDYFQTANFNLIIKDKITVKDRDNPLKCPINYIISFIHSTSHSVDEADPISSLLSHIA